MNRLLRHLDRLLHYLGALGLAGLAMVIAGLAVYFFLAQPAMQQAAAGQRQLAWLRAHPAPAMRQAAKEPGGAEALAEFYRQFPPAAELSGIIEQLHQLAREQGVTLRLGEYKLDAEGQGRLLRYEILLPVDAGYPQLRRFIDAAGRRFPTLGLKDVSFKREVVGNRTVQTRLNFMLYLSRQE